MDPNTVLALDDNGRALLVDVRERSEWAEGHIPGATHCSVDELAELSRELPTARTLILHSWERERSHRAARLLSEQGFEDIRILEGGLAAWRARGLPVTAAEPGEGDRATPDPSRSRWFPMWAKTLAGAACIVALGWALLTTTGLGVGQDGLAIKALAVGLAGGIVGGLVGGGLGLISVPLIVLLLGFPIHLAVGTNLFQTIFSGASGVYQHRRKGNVKFRLALPVITGAVVGAPLGAYVSLQLPEAVLLWIFSLVHVVLAGFLVKDLVGDDRAEKTGTDLSDKIANGDEKSPIGKVSEKVIGEKAADAVRDAVATPIEGEHQGTRFTVDRVTPVLLGLGVGFVAGMLGIGGGSLLVPLMTTLLGLPAHLAVGTGLVVITGNAAAGSVTHLLHHNVSMLAAVFLAAGGIAGTAVGSRLGADLGPRMLQGLLLIVVLAVAWKMAPIGGPF